LEPSIGLFAYFNKSVAQRSSQSARVFWAEVRDEPCASTSNFFNCEYNPRRRVVVVITDCDRP
jgi:hypothetical protein